MPDKQDSNETGLRYAEEDSFGVVSGDEVWRPLSPNSYADFGAEIETTPRSTIRADRQELKGSITDLDASGGFNIDLTQTNLTRLLQGFFFANIEEIGSTKTLNSAQLPITSVDTVLDQYLASGNGLDGIGLIAEHLILAADFDDANDGVKRVEAVAAGAIDVFDNLVTDASPESDASLSIIGYQFEVGTCDVNATPGAFPQLERASGAVDWTTIGLKPGDWIFIGSDEADTSFDTVANNGFARVRSVVAAAITLDKTDGTMVDEVGADETIRIYIANRITNDPSGVTGSTYNRRSYQVERTLGDDGVATQAEYLEGAIANELAINSPASDKVNMDLGFVAKDHTTNTGTVGVKAGTRPTVVDADAFNTSSDFSRLNINLLSEIDSNPTSLFSFMTELTMNISNGVTPNKAVALLGAFEMSAGNFVATGQITAYFNDVTSAAAVRNNTDVTLDAFWVKNNAGLGFEILKIALGDGRLDVEKDEPIMIPLSIGGSKDDTMLYTMAFFEFKYLPTVAAA